MAKSIEEIVQMAKKGIAEKNYDVVEAELSNYVRLLDTTDLCPKDTDAIEYHSFKEPIQEVLYYHMMKPSKEIKNTEEDYSGLYRIYGRLLIEKAEYERAKIELVKALRWNPLNIDAKLEYANCYRMLSDFEMYKALSLECLKYGYYTSAIATAYANLAYYYMYKRDYKLSTALATIGREFKRDSEDVNFVIACIEKATGKRLKDIDGRHARKLFEKNKIPWGANDEVISTIYSYGQHYIRNNDYKLARYFLRYAYSLSADREVLRLLKILPTY